MKTDLEIQHDMIEELKWEPLIGTSDIDVSVINGVVILSGTVDQYSKKKAAEEAVKRVQGVRALAEDIAVKFDPQHTKTDSEIAEAILDAFKWNSIVPEDKIKVKVEHGWVTLSGEVEWTHEKKAMKRVVENLIGVKGICNLITIKPVQNTGLINVKKEIEKAFRRNATIDSDSIFVENIGNKIILKGTVRSFSEKRKVEHIVWNALGVSIVVNNLDVKIPQTS